MGADVITQVAQDQEVEKWKALHWLAVYTKSRHEKFVSEELRKKGVEYFLPLRKVTRHWSDRKKIIEEPLFPGYLFVRTAWIDRLPILNTKGVVCFVGKKSEPTPVSEPELLAVKRFADKEIPMDPFPYLKEGQRVYVRSGPLKGVEGFVVRKDSHCRLVISLDVLNQSISAIIDEACIEAR